MKQDTRIILLLFIISSISIFLCGKTLADDERPKWIRVKAKITAYVPITERHGKYNDGKTALGDDATKLDGVAVDPDVIPYRTHIFIPGVGMKEADDTGAAMRNSDKLLIDLRVKNTEIAREWGVKYRHIFIQVNK